MEPRCAAARFSKSRSFISYNGALFVLTGYIFQAIYSGSTFSVTVVSYGVLNAFVAIETDSAPFENLHASDVVRLLMFH